MRTCVFCGERANSREDLWPKWVIALIGDQPIRHAIHGSLNKVLPKAELKSKRVCKKCNNEWMSELENSNKPLLSCLMQDISTPIDAEQRTGLIQWSMKTAMTFDTIRPNRCFSAFECEAFRNARMIPEYTKMWVGRLDASHLAAVGTDLRRADLSGQTILGKGVAFTLVTGHLVIQVFNFHSVSHFDPTQLAMETEAEIKRGNWNQLLTEIFPSIRPIQWPPPLSFSNTGRYPLGSVMDRWRVGRDFHADPALDIS